MHRRRKFVGLQSPGLWDAGVLVVNKYPYDDDTLDRS